MNLLFAAQLLPRFPPNRKRVTQSKIFWDPRKDITTLAAIIIAMWRVAVEELCYKPQSESRSAVN
jgi:hypothetical protein